MKTCANHSKAAAAAIPERVMNKTSNTKRGNSDLNKVMSDKIRRTLELRERRKAMTLGLYCLKCKDGNFGIPYCAVSDHFALLAQKQLLPLSDCYLVGHICLLDGVVTSVKPCLILENGVSHD